MVAGDTLSSMAAAHKTTVASLMGGNGLTNPDLIEGLAIDSSGTLCIRLRHRRRPSEVQSKNRVP